MQVGENAAVDNQQVRHIYYSLKRVYRDCGIQALVFIRRIGCQRCLYSPCPVFSSDEFVGVVHHSCYFFY